MTAGRPPAESHLPKRQKRGSHQTRRALRYLAASIVLAAITAAGIYANVRYGEMPIAVGERGSIVGTATPDGSGQIYDTSSDPSDPYEFGASNGHFDAQFSEKATSDATVRLSTDWGPSLAFGLIGAENVPRTVEGNVISFHPDANIRVDYKVLDDRIKEDILLLGPPASNVLTFDLNVEGLEMRESADGYHFFAPGDEEIFWLQQPTIESLGSVQGAVTMTIEGSRMRLVIDQAFLDKAFYPVTIDPTVVGTSTNAASTAYSNTRKLFEASDGNLIFFYQRGTDIVFKVSPDDGASWTAETVASTSNSTQFGAKMDEDDNVYLAYYDDSAAGAIRFRRFMYAGSGVWNAGTQWAVETGGAGRGFPDVFRDDSGRVWVAYRFFNGAAYSILARYSDSSLPGWTEPGSVWSSPAELEGPSATSRMYPQFVYYKGMPSVVLSYPAGTTDVLAWRYWTGSTWSTEETVPSVSVTAMTVPLFSAVSTFDSDVHVLFRQSNGIQAVVRDDATGSWSGPTAVSTTTGDTYPTVTTSGGGVRVFWSSLVGTNQRQLVCKDYNGSSWDVTPTILTPSTERTFDRAWITLATTPWNDTQTDRDALFRFTEGASYYGNQIAQSSSLGYALSTATRKASVKFTADETATIAAFRLYVNRTGTAPTYRVGLQTDATGYPSGSWLGGNAYVDAADPGGGWNQFDIPDSVVSSGSTYHIVMEYVGGTVNTSNYARFSYTIPNLLPAEAVTTYNGTTWATLNATPSYVLERTDGVVEGQSIRATTYYSVNATGLRGGERFTPQSNVTPSAVEMFIARVGTPADDLRLKIVQGTDTELFSGTVATPASPTSYTWMSLPISGLTLSAGETYRVFATSDGVDSANHYRVLMGLSNTGSPYPELTWGGTTDTACNALAGSGWTDKTAEAAGRTVSDIPIMGSNGDAIYLGMTEKFDYIYFLLGVSASASTQPTWEYYSGSSWSPLTLTENPAYAFTASGRVGFAAPADWAPTSLNGETTPKYYVRVTRTAPTVATTPVATQMTAVRNNSYPTVVDAYNSPVPYAWTEGLASPYRVKFDAMDDVAPEISNAEARHIDRDSHETTITWLTNIPATSQIVYDTTSHPTAPYSEYAYSTPLDPTLVQSHQVTVSGLTSETVYYYRILSMSESGDLTVSDERLIPPGDYSVETDLCASCHRSHTAFRTETWTDSTGTRHSGLLIRQP